jgi:hypothetical protein
MTLGLSAIRKYPACPKRSIPRSRNGLGGSWADSFWDSLEEADCLITFSITVLSTESPQKKDSHCAAGDSARFSIIQRLQFAPAPLTDPQETIEASASYPAQQHS